MKKLYIAFLWHMHQPLYKDYLTERYYLPWVRLHALKGYYDMPVLLERFPDMKATFNLTPSLLLQLNDYAANDSVNDDFLIVSKRKAEDLTREDKEFILANFFMNNWDIIIKPHPRYGELLRKRGLHYTVGDVPKIIERFDRQDFLDLQVLFNISWFGFAFRTKNAELEGIYRKERGFSEEEKMRVLSLQQDAIKEIIPLYKRLYDTGQIELTTTPYYHPILPILNSGVSSYGYTWEEDVVCHIEKALELFTSTFGRRPKGIWPAEGSVSRSILYPFVKRGIEWLATDEEILLASLGGGNRNELIYKPYSIKSGDGYITMVFRDKKLSDLIGFSYANSRPEHAAEDFLKNLRSIHRNVSGFGGEHLVSIILDGENAWEYYRDGGERFLSLLYEKICADPSLETVTVGDFIQRFPPSDELHNLYAGSWINHNFDIWYGHHEDKVGWEYVDRTRTFLKSVQLEGEKSKHAWEEIYAAEGSDWFWWFGDEFSSLSESTFDFLFRNHLMNVYRIAERAIPDYLQEPIKRKVKVAIKQEPIAFVNPVIDGRVSTYYEWIHAGVYALDDVLGAMQTAEKSIDTIYYGFNLTTLFFRLDINRNTPRERLKKCKGCLELITENRTYRLTFTFAKDAVLELYDVTDGKTAAINVFDGALSFDKIVEISCSFSSLCVQPNESIHFSFLLIENDIPVEKWPKFTTINFAVPDVDFEEKIWSA